MEKNSFRTSERFMVSWLRAKRNADGSSRVSECLGCDLRSACGPKIEIIEGNVAKFSGKEFRGSGCELGEIFQ